MRFSPVISCWIATSLEGVVGTAHLGRDVDAVSGTHFTETQLYNTCLSLSRGKEPELPAVKDYVTQMGYTPGSLLLSEDYACTLLQGGENTFTFQLAKAVSDPNPSVRDHFVFTHSDSILDEAAGLVYDRLFARMISLSIARSAGLFDTFRPEQTRYFLGHKFADFGWKTLKEIYKELGGDRESSRVIAAVTSERA